MCRRAHRRQLACGLCCVPAGVVAVGLALLDIDALLRPALALAVGEAPVVVVLAVLQARRRQRQVSRLCQYIADVWVTGTPAVRQARELVNAACC